MLFSAVQQAGGRFLAAPQGHALVGESRRALAQMPPSRQENALFTIVTWVAVNDLLLLPNGDVKRVIHHIIRSNRYSLV